MGFFEDFFQHAKDTVDTVGKKTDEVIQVQKQKITLSSLKSKRENDFAVLGKLCFAEIGDSVPDDADVAAIVDSIRVKNEQIEALEKEVASAKNQTICPACGAAILKNSVYCSSCGQKLNFDSTEDFVDQAEEPLNEEEQNG